MPQLALTDRELLKKTLRTTAIMVGITGVWLGVLSGAILASTPAAPVAAESKSDKLIPASAVTGPAVTVPASPLPRFGRRPSLGSVKPGGPRPSDPI